MSLEVRDTLDQLGRKYDTDKSSVLHDYLQFYERYFAPIRDQKLTLLEIGVFNGASLSTWEEYFPNARIIGADIDPKTGRYVRKRVKIRILDQSNIEDLTRLAIDYGPFDIIIEDGSHMWEHQTTTLKTLFPHLKQNGIYIAEDLQTNYGAMARDYRGNASLSCVEYLKKLVDLRVADNQLDISEEEDPFLRTYGRAVRTITFYRRACLIEKAGGLVSHFLSDQPYRPVGQSDSEIGLILRAHLGHIGDIAAEKSWLRPHVDDHHIQGFAIEIDTDIACIVEYRARLADGSWTEWSMNGDFVGTNSMAQDLIGFTIRLGGSPRNDFDLQAIGHFNGTFEELVIVGDGEDCVSSADTNPLSGMQIIITRKSA